MSTDIKTAVCQHALDVGRLYLQNAVLGRGIPDQPARLQIETQAEPTPPPPTPAPSNEPASSRPASQLAQWGALAISAIAGSGAIAIPWAIYGTRQLPPIVPVNPPAPASSRPDGSLLQYLEDRGLHLPPEKRPQ